LLNIMINYPTLEEEENILLQTTGDINAQVTASMDRETLLRLQHAVRRIPVSHHVIGYATDLVRATRLNDSSAPSFIKEQVGWGAGPRAGQALILCAKATAALHGRINVSCDDVRRLALPVMRHRIAPSFVAEAEGITTDQILTRVLESVPERSKA